MHLSLDVCQLGVVKYLLEYTCKVLSLFSDLHTDSHPHSTPIYSLVAALLLFPSSQSFTARANPLAEKPTRIVY